MKRTYECMCLLDNREVRQGWQALKDNVTGMFTKHGHEVVSARRWEERRLAFPINHQQRGTYLLVYFNGESESIAPLRRELQLNESVMRNLILTCDQIPEEAHQPEEEFDESQVVVEDVYQAPPPPVAATEEEAGEEAGKEAGKGAGEEAGKGAGEEAGKGAGEEAGEAGKEAGKEAGEQVETKEDVSQGSAESEQAAEDRGDDEQEVKE